MNCRFHTVQYLLDCFRDLQQGTARRRFVRAFGVREVTNLASMPLAGEFNVPPHVELAGIKQLGKFACCDECE